MVKRYAFYPDPDDRVANMEEDSSGDYVLHSDYSALQAERDKLRTALEYYADEAIYAGGWQAEAAEDRGAKARLALSGKEE